MKERHTAEKEASKDLPKWREELLKLVEEIAGEPTPQPKPRPEAMGSGSRPRDKPPDE